MVARALRNLLVFLPLTVTFLPALPDAAATDRTAASSISYPFASRLKPYVAGIKPTVASQPSQDALVRGQYERWKAGGVKARCGGQVVVHNDAYLTLSEGAGYGMLLSVLMAGYDKEAKSVFDGLLRVVRAHPAYSTGNGALMEWRVKPDCSGGGDGWNALDGDLDIAMALLMADKQWGSAGLVNYKAQALATIAAIKAHNMSKDGYTKGLPNGNNTRTSDYMITHFRAFRRATGDAFWDLAIDKAFELLDLMQTRFARETGLIPDFIINAHTSAPSPSPGFIADGNANEGFYFWNACRLPWRLASDYVTSGDNRSKVITARMVDFFNRASGGDPSRITAGYKLDGTALSNLAAPAFIGPVTAGAMVDARFHPFLDRLWSYSTSNLGRGYYETELQLLSLVVVSGNWWNP